MARRLSQLDITLNHRLENQSLKVALDLLLDLII